MAQWIGQYSGLTHETKVQDLEESLRKAIKAFYTVSESERKSKLKAVLHISERLLVTRSKVLRTRISALDPRQSTNGNKLWVREQNLHAQGVAGILKEFGFNENHVSE